MWLNFKSINDYIYITKQLLQYSCLAVLIKYSYFLRYLSYTSNSADLKHLMVKRKGSPKKHSPKKPRTDPPPYTLIYKGVKFIDIGSDVGVFILNMLGLWNAKASEMMPGNESTWNESMEVKPTHSEECFGLFVKKGNIKNGKLIALMKGEIIISPKGGKKCLPPTHYDIQPIENCTYTISDADGNTTVHEFDCYVRGTGIQEPFNGQLCNHTCLEEHQTCRFINMEPVEISLTEGGVIHTLSLPLVGIESIKDITEGSECLVNYGEFMLSDKEAEGFVPCQCASCVSDPGKGKFIMI